jgi:hypothetical protein
MLVSNFYGAPRSSMQYRHPKMGMAVTLSGQYSEHDVVTCAKGNLDLDAPNVVHRPDEGAAALIGLGGFAWRKALFSRETGLNETLSSLGFSIYPSTHRLKLFHAASSKSGAEVLDADGQPLETDADGFTTLQPGQEIRIWNPNAHMLDKCVRLRYLTEEERVRSGGKLFEIIKSQGTKA